MNVLTILLADGWYVACTCAELVEIWIRFLLQLQGVVANHMAAVGDVQEVYFCQTEFLVAQAAAQVWTSGIWNRAAFRRKADHCQLADHLYYWRLQKLHHVTPSPSRNHHSDCHTGTGHPCIPSQDGRATCPTIVFQQRCKVPEDRTESKTSEHHLALQYHDSMEGQASDWHLNNVFGAQLWGTAKLARSLQNRTGVSRIGISDTRALITPWQHPCTMSWRNSQCSIFDICFRWFMHCCSSL